MTPPSTSYLYVIETGDRIKVGRATRPENRLNAHRANAKVHGCLTGREWVSEPGVGTPANELALITFCAQSATGRIGREYFTGVAFETAVACAENLTAPRVKSCGSPSSTPLMSVFASAWGRDNLAFQSLAAFVDGDDARSRELLCRHLDIEPWPPVEPAS